MSFDLKSVEGWYEGLSCTPTALCAVTGMTPEEIGIALQAAAKKHGAEVPAEPQKCYATRHWHTAIIDLGGSEQMNDAPSYIPFQNRETIGQFLKSNVSEREILIVCTLEDDTDAHVLAAKGKVFVDTFTRGQLKNIDNLGDYFTRFRVKYVLEIA